LNSAGVVAGAPLLVTAAANPWGNLDPFYFVRCESPQKADPVLSSTFNGGDSHLEFNKASAALFWGFL
jgi:hypothetical protein